MADELATLEQAVEDCLATPVLGLSSPDLVDRMCRLQSVAQRLLAAQLGLIREADGRGLAREQGAANTTSWLASLWRLHPGTVSRWIKLARQIDTVMPAAGEALATGLVNADQLQVIGPAVEHLPAEHRAAGEAFLLEQATVFAPRELGRLTERLLQVVAPEVGDEAERKAVERAERQAYRQRTLSVFPVSGTNSVRIAGWLDREDGAIVQQALDPLCAPRFDRDPGTSPDPEGGRDSRSPAQRRADALVDVCRIALACGEVPDNGGYRPQVVVTVPLAVLRQQIDTGSLPGTSPLDVNQLRPVQPGGVLPRSGGMPASGSNADAPGTDRQPAGSRLAPGPVEATATGLAELDDGSRISAAAARRLACDAGIIPAVLGGEGQVLDLGRQRRLFIGPVRRALVLRDKGCAFPSCDRPARWTDGHHIRHWVDGGATNLDNAVLLCGFHHRLIHRGDWTVRINRGDGLPDFIPPIHLDALQRPRRNTFHRRE